METRLSYWLGPKLPSCHWYHVLSVKELPGQLRLKEQEARHHLLLGGLSAGVRGEGMVNGHLGDKLPRWWQ